MDWAGTGTLRREPISNHSLLEYPPIIDLSVVVLWMTKIALTAKSMLLYREI